MTDLKTPPKGANAAPMAAEASGKAIDVLIRKVGKAYGAAQSVVQETAIAIVLHAETFGDCTRAKTLCRAVPARERNSLIGYFALVSPIGVRIGKTAKEDAVRFIKPESKNYNKFDLAKAKALQWFDDPAGVNPEPKPLDTTADFYATLDRMLKAAIDKAEKTGDDAKFAEADRATIKADAAELRLMVGKFHAKRLASKAANDTTPVIPAGAETMAAAANG